VKGSQLPPRYPPLARRRAWEGTVVLRIHNDASGSVDSVDIDTSSGYGLLDREALRVAAQWRYQPGTRDGRAEAAVLLQPVEFRLRD
jgi:protein TonB